MCITASPSTCTAPILHNTITHLTTLSETVTVTLTNTTAAQRSVTRHTKLEQTLKLEEAQFSAGTEAQSLRYNAEQRQKSWKHCD